MGVKTIVSMEIGNCIFKLVSANLLPIIHSRWFSSSRWYFLQCWSWIALDKHYINCQNGYISQWEKGEKGKWCPKLPLLNISFIVPIKSWFTIMPFPTFLKYSVSVIKIQLECSTLMTQHSSIWYNKYFQVIETI